MYLVRVRAMWVTCGVITPFNPEEMAWGDNIVATGNHVCPTRWLRGIPALSEVPADFPVAIAEKKKTDL